MQELRRELVRIARYDTKVLITGESGVGKELVAGSIHRLSARASQAFVEVNCAGLSEGLLESELFGHVKGAFTDAYRDKPGKLELADRGTVFLDEVGEMTLRMQGLLLRFMEVGELQKVGSDSEIRQVNVRVVAATNRDLRQMVNEGRFREDLFYRLNVLHVILAPLRDRADDIPQLLDHFLRTFARHHDRVPPQITFDALDVLMAYDWPGNVRELRNVVERLVVSDCDPVRPQDLPFEVLNVKRAEPHHRQMQETLVDALMKQMRVDGVPFWNAVYPVFMSRDMTREELRELVRRGLETARGSYKIVARMFNLPDDDYKRFLGFLRTHECQVAFQQFRRVAVATDGGEIEASSASSPTTVVAYRDFDARRRASRGV
jgi:transcriptional regulator with PAS, ATPase and Fis domain